MARVVTRIMSESDHASWTRSRCALEVIRGPDEGARLDTVQTNLAVGTAEANDLVLTDPAVSRHHLRIEATVQGLMLTDLGSTNGTWIGHLKLRCGLVEESIDVRLGSTILRISRLRGEEEAVCHHEDRFGALIARSASMREVLRKLAVVSPQDVAVLLEGETGTGKELIAREIHAHSWRRDGPFVIIDCAAIPETLIEKALFGSGCNSMPDVEQDESGAFREAHGGTLFIREVGALQLSVQTKLFRALEHQKMRRVGMARPLDVDVRVIAATTKDLRQAITEGSFRSNLYYQLAVAHFAVPPLRDRVEDIPALVRDLLSRLAGSSSLSGHPILSEDSFNQLSQYAWPGNVHELRSVLERLIALSNEGEQPDLSYVLDTSPPRLALSIQHLEMEPFREAKTRWNEYFDQVYLSRLLERTKFNVAEAARQSSIDRVHLFRLVKKYKLRN